MNITVLSVEITTVPTAKGSYQKAQVAYKNNSFQGKIEGKSVMSFGASKNAFTTLSTVQSGQTFEVEIVKNAAGYNDWISLTPSDGNTPVAQAPVASSKAATAAPKSNYETAEERAQRQVLIVRQSSLSSAASVLTAGAKTPPSADAVITLAREFEAYVFGFDKSQGLSKGGPSGFEDMPDFDIPQVS